jgi:hypothetical protein
MKFADRPEILGYLTRDGVPNAGDIITTHSDALNRALRQVRVVRRHYVTTDAPNEWEQLVCYLIVEPTP